MVWVIYYKAIKRAQQTCRRRRNFIYITYSTMYNVVKLSPGTDWSVDLMYTCWCWRGKSRNHSNQHTVVTSCSVHSPPYLQTWLRPHLLNLWMKDAEKKVTSCRRSTLKQQPVLESLIVVFKRVCILSVQWNSPLIHPVQTAVRDVCAEQDQAFSHWKSSYRVGESVVFQDEDRIDILRLICLNVSS